MSKTLNTDSIENELRGASGFFSPQTPSPQPVEQIIPKQTHIFAQKVEQVSKPLSKQVSNSSDEQPQQPLNLPNVEDIERMTFELRKVNKSKLNTLVADEWKQELDEMAFRMHVGKYELLEYIIGQFLGKVKSKKG